MKKLIKSWVSNVAGGATTLGIVVAIVSLVWNMEGVNAVNTEGKVYFFKSTTAFNDSLFMLKIRFSNNTVEEKQVRDRDLFWPVDDYKTISAVTIIAPQPKSREEYRHEYIIKHPELHSGKAIVTWTWTWNEEGIKFRAYDEEDVLVTNISTTITLAIVAKYKHDG